MEHIIKFDMSTLPAIMYADYGFCRKPILHVDRTATHDVLLIILSGCMPVVEDGIEYFLKAGDIFFLKKGVHHWGETPFDENTSWFFIHFRHETNANHENLFNNTEDADIIPELSSDFRRTKNVQLAEADYHRVLTLPKHLHGMLNTEIHDKIKKVVELFNSDNPYMLAYVNSALHELLVDLYLFKRTNTDPDSSSARIRKIYRFLSDNVEKPFSPSDLEQHMELSFKHIGRIFKEHTGMTLHQCHTQFKIDLAIRMLCNGNLNITEISETLGFSDPLYFSNVFKKHTGLSPRAYRDKYSAVL